MTKTKPKQKYKFSFSLPDFSGCENWSGEEYHLYLRQARRFYYENYKEADLIKYIWSWMEQSGYSKTQIDNAKKESSTVHLGTVAGINCKLLLDGIPDYNEAYAQYWNSLKGTASELKPISTTLCAMIDSAIECGEHEPVKENPQPTPTRKKQDPVITAAIPIDEWLLSFKDKKWSVNSFDLKKHFRDSKLNENQVKKLGSLYQDEFDQYSKLVNHDNKELSTSEQEELAQLKESYKHLTKKQMVNYYHALYKIIEETEKFISLQPARKTSSKSDAQRMEESVSKLNFLARDEKNNLTSVKPETIIGSQKLWIFNTKTRKLGCYVADKIDPKGFNRAGLGIKGSTIIGFDIKNSMQKTIKNPTECFSKMDTITNDSLSALYSDLTTLDSRLDGKIKEYIILLHAV